MLVLSFPELKLDFLPILGGCVTDETLPCFYISENDQIWFTEIFILTYLCCWNHFILVPFVPASELLRAFAI